MSSFSPESGPLVTFAERASPDTIQVQWDQAVVQELTTDFSALVMTFDGFDHPVVDVEFFAADQATFTTGAPGAARAGSFFTYQPPPILFRNTIGTPAQTQIDFTLD